MPKVLRSLIMSLSDVLVIFGSQTGQSEALANEISERINKENDASTTRLFCMDQSEKKFWLERERVAVIVISSTGDGDAPDNAAKFVRRIHKADLPSDHLKNLKYALLGLGDSNYSTFLGIPKKVEKRLNQLGATQFYASGFCDDATGLEIVAEPWMEGLIPALKSALSQKSSETASTATELQFKTGNESKNVPELANGSEIETESKSKINDENQRIKNNSSSNDERDKGDLRELVEGFSCILPPSSEDDTTCLDLAVCQCRWPADKPSLVASTVLQTEADLRVPLVSEPYLAATVTDGKIDDSIILWQNGSEFPGTVGKMQEVSLVSVTEMTSHEAQKQKFEISVDLQGSDICYEPGDALYFVFPNPKEEVQYILKRLKLLASADRMCTLSVKENTKKDNAIVPVHLPTSCTLRHLLTWCVDIRRTPGRPLLRVLAEFATETKERRRLLELCSSQGLKEFTSLVRQAGLSLADILHAFPSCMPPVERIIEHLPRLQPRPYSFACSTLETHGRARFVYSLINIPRGNGRFYSRQGLCTGFLTKQKPGTKLRVILKEASWFRLPEKNAASTPLILIGPGTGVGPFLGFLQQLKASKETDSCSCVARWLFFGCRRLDHDFIYRSELEGYNQSGLLSNLVVCESQPLDNPLKVQNESPIVCKYVQDAVRLHGKQLVQLLMAEENGLNKNVSAENADSIANATTGNESAENVLTEKARIYVCGDAQGMSKDVFAALVDILKEHAGKSQVEAVQYLAQLKKEHRFVEDVWS